MRKRAAVRRRATTALSLVEKAKALTKNDLYATSQVSRYRLVVSKRFVKKQQQRWTKKGVHLLLQVRTQVLNQELAQTFQRWYPGFKEFPLTTSATEQLAA